MTFAVTENGKKVLTMAEYIEREALLREIERREALMVGDKLVSVDAMKSFIKNRPAADVAPVQKWINIKDRLPEPEQEVFVCVKSKISNYSYVCCAMHVPENWYRQSSDFCWDFECCDEYDEEQDDYIVKQGWYESIHNWDDYSVVGIEDIVTHWMPLPQPPKGE